ncbi:variable surface protein, partial [Plasmodium gonderi]
KIKNICDCLIKSASEDNYKCPCDNISSNSELSGVFDKFKKCNEKNVSSANGVSNTSPHKFKNLLDIYHYNCYLNVLKEILSVKDTTTLCGINVSEHKESVKKILTYIEVTQKIGKITLSSVRLTSSIVAFVMKLFLSMMKNISFKEIVLPLCVSLSVTIILIFIFYQVDIIYALGPCLHKCNKKKKIIQNCNEELQYRPFPHNVSLYENVRRKNYYIVY